MASSSSSSVRLLAFWSAVVCVLVCVPSVDLTEDIECYGTTSFLSKSGSNRHMYENLKERYDRNCTYVHGNLEITWLKGHTFPHDISFLKTIRYVQGYVLIGLNRRAETIPLDNLEIIRGNGSFDFGIQSYNGTSTGIKYGLTVVVNESNLRGLKQLHMPKLQEISSGRVFIKQNRYLGYINTIDWTSIVRGKANVVFLEENAYNASVASRNETSICASGSRWGDSPELCQTANWTYNSTECHNSCNGRCFGPGQNQCCHDSCAVGCTGTEDTQCVMCKDFSYNGRCVGYCPANTCRYAAKCLPC